MPNMLRTVSTATTEAKVAKVGVMVAIRKISLAFLALAICFATIPSDAVSGDDKKPKQILLDEGRLPDYRWGLVAYRGSGVAGGKRPCIVTIIYFRADWGIGESDDTVCGPLPRGGPPEIRSYSFGSGEDAVTIFAVAFERRVASIRINLGEGEEVRSHLHLVNDKQKRIAAIRPFRFQTFAIRGPSCVGEVTGFNSNGVEIYRSPAEGCSKSYAKPEPLAVVGRPGHL